MIDFTRSIVLCQNEVSGLFYIVIWGIYSWHGYWNMNTISVELLVDINITRAPEEARTQDLPFPAESSALPLSYRPPIYPCQINHALSGRQNHEKVKVTLRSWSFRQKKIIHVYKFLLFFLQEKDFEFDDVNVIVQKRSVDSVGLADDEDIALNDEGGSGEGSGVDPGPVMPTAEYPGKGRLRGDGAEGRGGGGGRTAGGSRTGDAHSRVSRYILGPFRELGNQFPIHRPRKAKWNTAPSGRRLLGNASFRRKGPRYPIPTFTLRR